MSEISRPFEGIRVADASTAVSGPICSYFLGLLGAEVIRIDNPVTNDITRILDSDENRSTARMGWSYLMLNATKKSLAVNLKDESGKEIFKRLIKASDVFIENFRPGVMEGLGLGPDILKDINPKLIYCSISGFGQDSPIRHYPAFDNIIQGMSGLMSITGTAASGPMRVGTAIIDCMTGLNSAFAIASALFQRGKTGLGQRIDVAMMDTILSMMTIAVGEYLYEGQSHGLRGNEPITRSPFAGCFNTKDGLLILAANTKQQIEALVKVLNISELLQDSRILQWMQYPEAGEKARSALENALLEKTAEEWENILAGERIPAGKVREIQEVINHPNTEIRGILKEIYVSSLEQSIRTVGCGFKFQMGGPEIQNEPPMIGSDTKCILSELGYSDKDMENLEKSAVIASA